MAEERIDIVATDKVDAAIPRKLGQIADSAERAETYLKRLQTALSAVNATSIDRLASAMAKADSAHAQLINAQARLTAAQNQGALAAEKVALAQQKVATEAARTSAAQAKAATATTAAELAAMRLTAAQTKANGASNAAAASSENVAAAMGAEAAGMNNTAGAAARMANATNEAAASNGRMASSGVAVGAAGTRMAAGYGNVVNAANQYQRAQRTTSFVNANIIAQMQDIGVSLAGGQNPLLVLIQQGSQLSYIATTLGGGWKQLVGIMLSMLAPLAPLLVALALLAGFFKDIKNAAEDFDPAGKKFIATLGLTHKEIERLKDTSVTWGDTFGGVMDTIADRLGTTTANMKKWFADAFSSIIEFCKFSVAIIYGFFYATVKSIIQDWQKLPAAIGAAVIGAANLVLKAVTGMVNFGVKGINLLIEGTNKAFGTNLEPIGEMVAYQLTNPLAKEGKQVVEDWVSNLHEGMSQVQRFADDAATAANRRRDARLRAQADKIIGDRTPKKPKEDHSAERRALAIAMVNMKLDDEIKRMHMLKDEREIQQRMDQIEESLAQKKIHLNDAERKTILDKVTAIQAYKYVQAEMDRVYEDAIGPMRTYESTLKAIQELLDKHAISVDRAAQETVKATRAYQAANDPLFQLKEGLVTAEAALGKYGMAAEQGAFYEQIRQAELAKGIVLSPQYVAGVNAEVDALMRRNMVLLQGQAIHAQTQQLVDPLIQQQQDLQNKEAYYAEIDRLEKASILNHSNAMTARFMLDQKYSQQSLQNWSGFFGNLATLQSSGNKKLALIGKAAAVAQATIQGIQAVQNALATPAPWPLPLVFAAAAGVAAAANIAKIISTPVGNYATGGQFMVEGRSGIDANNINMNVTRGERVTVETAAQQRANDNSSAAGPVVVRAQIVNNVDGKDLLSLIDSGDHDHVIMNVISRNSNQVTELVSRNG